MPSVACTIVAKKGRLYFRIFYRKMKIWQKANLSDTPKGREYISARARVMSDEIKNGSFDYLRWFPNGNKAHLFRRDQDLPQSRSYVTVEKYFTDWITKQGDRVRAHRVKDYNSIKLHVLTARVGESIFGQIPLGLLQIGDLKNLQVKLKAKGLKARSVNGVIHSCLRAMLRDARVDGHIKANLFDRDFFKSLSLTDTKPSVDPYTPEEREIILEEFRVKKRHYYRFVYFHFWQGPRPSESTALRYMDVDLRHGAVLITKSRVGGKESGTKTERSNREIQLHDNVVKVLSSLMPLHAKPEDYFFTTPSGAPISEDNFYHREWLPILRRAKNIRPRPFYNTRHSYVSFLYSNGASSGFISKQTGDSIKTLERDYAKYIKEADSRRDLVESQIGKSENSVRTALNLHKPARKQKTKSP